MEMDIINIHCAGIDVGSRSHFVAVGQSLQEVKEFGVYADDLTDICLHLKNHNITSVAMESTRVSVPKVSRQAANTILVPGSEKKDEGYRKN